MAFCILKLNATNGSNFEMNLNEFLPDITSKYNLCLYEDESYEMEILVQGIDSPIDQIVLYINNDKIDNIKYTVQNENIVTIQSDRYFFMRYDLSFISIDIITHTGIEYTFYGEYFAVGSKNTDVLEHVERMIKEIEEMNVDVLQSCFGSDTPEPTQSSDKSLKHNIYSTIKILQEILECYRRNYKFFCMSPKYVVGSVSEVVNYDKASQINPSGFHWIINNPDIIKKTKHKTQMCYGKDYIMPLKVLSNRYENNYDIYENRIVLGFINDVVQIVTLLCQRLDNMLSSIELSVNEFSKNLAEGYFIPAFAIKLSLRHRYEKLCQHFLQIEKELRKLSYFYRQALKCTPVKTEHIPMFTHTFQAVPHYREIFIMLKKWKEFGYYNFVGTEYLFSMKSVDKIYEYYCLLKMVECFKNKGYKLENEGKPPFVYERPKSNYKHDTIRTIQGLSNTYHFSNADGEVILYYEPIIYSYDVEDSNQIDLYRIDSEVNYFLPDFLIKYKPNKSKNCYYAVMDAKYSTVDSIKNNELKEEVFKYICSVADRNSHFSSVIFFWMLQGRPDKCNEYNLHKSRLTKQVKPLPSIGIQQLNPDTPIDEVWQRLTEDFFSIANLLKE